ncbi:MAG: ABC transporter ATP-binding protein [Lachnospiraceae bacterium]|nr:ABC transporter ATP-binding protein/permease [Lachnospiraceae bacterium]MDY3223392.1 ABC transporter ATP-binding protein [Lachnospiraceae bacterium]
MKKIKNFIKQMQYIFERRQKLQLLFVLFIVIFTTFVELLGVTAILPLIEVMMNENSINETPYLNMLYRLGGFGNSTNFLIFLAVVLIVIYWIKNFLVAVSYNLQYKFTFSNQKRMAYKLLECYLSQPYFFHLSHSSAELIRSINTDIVMMFQGILALLQFFAEILVCLVLGSFLFFTDPQITIIIVIALLLFVVLFTKKIKSYLSYIGEEDRKFSMGIVKWLQQSFGGLKETKIMHREKFFLGKFEEQYSQWADLEKIYRNLQMIPKPIMETLSITALMIAIILKLLSGTQMSSFMTTISVFAIAAFRLLPSFNRITGYVSVIIFNFPAFEAVYQDLKRVDELLGTSYLTTQDDEGALPLREKIQIRNLSYKYPEGEDYVLRDVNISIPKNKSIALVGPSGAGKTTLADLILGVLEPTKGNILIDEADAFTHLTAWQKNVGYIPQTIYLMDDTIRNNIIYGAEAADEERLMKAVEEAQLKEFIESLSEGLDTEVGERGIRLSGGQRQRIGIARALYSNPEVLVLDEATSALDNETEKAVMDAIDSLSGSKTLIIIAHRLTTVENCDIKYEVKNGGVNPVQPDKH